MIDRKTVIHRSVDAYLHQQLYTVRGYPADRVVILDAYPDNERMHRPLDKNYIALGYATDDGGRFAEIGSSAKRRRYTFDYYIFAISRVWGRNLGGVIESALESDGVINILDPTNNDAEIGFVEVEFVSSQQAAVRTPRPWEENAWIVRLRVEDAYYSSAGGG